MVHHHHHHSILINFPSKGPVTWAIPCSCETQISAKTYLRKAMTDAKVQCQSDPIDHPRMDQNETRNHETGAFSNRFLDFDHFTSIYIYSNRFLDFHQFQDFDHQRDLIIFFGQKHPRLRTNGIHISYTPIGPTMSQVCVDSLQKTMVF